MIEITYVGKTATCTLELDREISDSGWWIPDCSTIYVDPMQSDRCYEAIPSPLYQHKPIDEPKHKPKKAKK